MTPHFRKRFWFASALALLSLAGLALTLLSSSWIERLTGLDPDGASGVVEWAVVLLLLTVTVSASGLARGEFRRAAAMAAAAR